MTQTTVREIATTIPAAVRVFEKYNIDYCCGGHRPLGEACRERGLSPEAVLAEVEASARPEDSGRNWSQAPLADLIAHILRTHHAYLNTELPLLEARLAKIVEKHGSNYPASLPPLQQVFAGLKAELESHCLKEEMVLFPVIEELETAAAEGRAPAPPPFGTVRNPIRMLILEHDSAGNALREMRRLTQDYAVPDDVCPTYRATFADLQALERDLHQHIHLENNILFPRAAALES
jgi:regulator of cell morphogenesis and NO signaling